jgi:hypothetical protein
MIDTDIIDNSSRLLMRKKSLSYFIIPLPTFLTSRPPLIVLIPMPNGCETTNGEFELSLKSLSLLTMMAPLADCAPKLRESQRKMRFF